MFDLRNNVVGLGKTPVLPFCYFVIAEDQHTTMVKASEAYAFLLGFMLGKIGDILLEYQFASDSDV